MRDLHLHGQVRAARHGHDKLPVTLVDEGDDARLEDVRVEVGVDGFDVRDGAPALMCKPRLYFSLSYPLVKQSSRARA